MWNFYYKDSFEINVKCTIETKLIQRIELNVTDNAK